MTEENKKDDHINVEAKQPDKTTDTNNINYQEELTKALSRIESLEKSLSATKQDPLKDLITNDEAKAKDQQNKEYLTTFYADVKNNFNNAYGAKAKEYENNLKDVSSLEDKINFMAKAIIRKAYGDSETTNNHLDSFKSPVFNIDSAFYAKYSSAIEKLESNKSSINANLFNSRSQDIDIKELSKLRNEIIDFRTKDTAVNKAKSLGLIKAS